jgi:hypothetical protein
MVELRSAAGVELDRQRVAGIGLVEADDDRDDPSAVVHDELSGRGSDVGVDPPHGRHVVWIEAGVAIEDVRRRDRSTRDQARDGKGDRQRTSAPTPRTPSHPYQPWLLGA